MPMDVLKTYHNKLKNGEKHYQISAVKSPTHSLVIAKEILNEIKNGIFEIKHYASGEEPIRDRHAVYKISYLKRSFIILTLHKV